MFKWCIGIPVLVHREAIIKAMFCMTAIGFVFVSVHVCVCVCVCVSVV